jgi:hypothetical protein
VRRVLRPLAAAALAATLVSGCGGSKVPNPNARPLPGSPDDRTPKPGNTPGGSIPTGEGTGTGRGAGTIP